MPITPVKTLVAEAKEQIETLPQTEVETLLASNEIVLLDIRDIRELKRDGRIPGAIHAPRGMLEFWIDPESPYHKPDFATDKKLVLFCASAWRSALAVKNLQDIGVENIAEMADGFSAWKSRGAAVETE